MNIVQKASNSLLIFLLILGVTANAFSVSYSQEFDHSSLSNDEVIADHQDDSLLSFLINFSEEQENEEQNSGEEDSTTDEEIEYEDIPFHLTLTTFHLLQNIIFCSKSDLFYNTKVSPKKYLLYQNLKIYC